jgi:amidase
VEPFLWELSRSADDATPQDRERAARWSEDWVERTVRWFDDVDLLLLPTVHEPAPPLAELDPTRLAPLELLDRMVHHMALTEPWNATGQPAISLPMGLSKEGLPVGVQLVARAGEDATLLSVAASLSGPRPDPGDPRPAIHA